MGGTAIAADEREQPAGRRDRGHRAERSPAAAHDLAVAQPAPVREARSALLRRTIRVLNGAMTNGAVHRPSAARDGRPASGGCGVSGSAARSGLSANGSATRRRAARSRRISSTWPRIESTVPPLSPPRAVATSRTSRSPPAPSAAARSCSSRTAEVGRHRVVAAGVHDPRAGPAGERVVPVDRRADEQHLAGEVGVVRPGPRAGLDQRQPVPGVRPDGRRDHPRRAGERGQRRRVGGVGLEQRPVRAPPAASPSRTAASFSRDRPARAIRLPGGACSARCAAVSAPTNPVAP